jgi:enediyne biosynthesis protein E4
MNRTGHFTLLFVTLFICSCTHSGSFLFLKVPSNKSHINFINKVSENDSINPLRQEFLYNGGGVGVADFNNDGLMDLYFTASTSSNKLYLNTGDLKFRDITEEAEVTGEGRWSNGVTVVDINNDGWKDIYVSTSIKSSPQERKNLFYINQGLNKNGIPVFKEMAKEYGLDDTTFSVQAAFLDYDKDGDLDMYLATTKPTTRNSYTFNNKKDTSGADYDRLYRNTWSSIYKHPVFTDVSLGAGIREKGYGLGVTVGDVNNDGWPDIYVTNDFISSDHLYINNRNGTFSNRVKDCLKHTSQNAMGNDVSDVNNDGWPDLVAVDMNPEDNFRKQKNMAATNYAKYRNMSDFGYSLQFVRNTLQINLGMVQKAEDSLEIPVFSDISYYAGVAETDWSWTPSVADFDNDGLRDLLITNGYPKDVTDHDYISYRKDKGFIVSEQELLQQIPEIKVANYAFRNTPELKFENVSQQWGLNDEAYSTGAAYADLDNDGDLDYIINNINERASVYENTSNHRKQVGNNFIRIRFHGEAFNKDGIGAKATVYYNGAPHMYENYPTRGYLSSVEQVAHFGLGDLQFADSILIQWPNGKVQKLNKTPSNKTITVDISEALIKDEDGKQHQPLFSNINSETDIRFVHEEYDFIDFDYQKLLPHKLSESGPALASADVDGNGLDDLFISGAKGKPSYFLLQQSNGKFIQRRLQNFSNPFQKPSEELGALLIDVDNDLDFDLYLCSGGNEFGKNDSAYRDRLFINDGKGNFKDESNALPENLNSKQVVKAIDFDSDGDLDLFIGSRSIPHEFPKPASGFLYRNDTRKGVIKFTDVTEEIAPELRNLGLITDAVWSDFNNDEKIDLVICGEFMSVMFFSNLNGKFKKAQTGVDSIRGLWNSITPADIDNDGKTDYIIGNLGLNTFYKASKDHPFTIYADDFDNNGGFDALPFLFLKDGKGSVAEFPAFTRDDMIQELIRIRRQFPTYKDFATATVQDILTEDERKKALKVSANYTESAILKNGGRGKFTVIPLRYQAQWSPVYGVLTDDFNNDGNIDLLLNTNDLGTEVNTGQYDALNGMLLIGKGDGTFEAQSISASGFYIPSNGKAIVKFAWRNKYAIAASQNKGALQVFQLNSTNHMVRLKPSESVALLYLKNGSIRREEMYYGNSFLSQSSRFVLANKEVSRIKIMGRNGQVRQINF